MWYFRQEKNEFYFLICKSKNALHAYNKSALCYPKSALRPPLLNLSPLICLTDIDRPKGLAFTAVDVDSIKIAWESPQGQVTGYRVTYSTPEDGIQELFPAPDGEDDTAELHGLRPGSEYTVYIVALHNDLESLPLIGTQTTGTHEIMSPGGHDTCSFL